MTLQTIRSRASSTGLDALQPWRSTRRQLIASRGVATAALDHVRGNEETSPTASTSKAEGPARLKKADWKRRQKDATSFIDSLRLTLHSGRGGNGGVSFHREKFVEKGPPSGGPGGQGGSVYLLASPTVSNLSHLPRSIRAGAGGTGAGNWLAGKRGEDVFVKVPLGTVVRELEESETEEALEAEEEQKQDLKLAWEANKIRMDEAVARDTRWETWRKARSKGAKEAWDEFDLIPLSRNQEQALEKVRKTLFVTYPGAGGNELQTHPVFLLNEHRYLSHLLEREADVPTRKTQRRRNPAQQDAEPVYYDLTAPTPLTDPILLLSGGTAGLGNSAFLSNEDRSPKYATRGGEGSILRLQLELKAVSDVGLIGVPNAGKSTILRALTSSTPRVASYPFTTLNPHQGTCILFSDGTFTGAADEQITDTPDVVGTFTGQTVAAPAPRPHPHPADKGRTETMRFRVTDNPGLVEHASENVGLGHAFLRHIERCSSLVYVVDLSEKDPVATVAMLRKELQEYAKAKGLAPGALETKVTGLVANKADLFADDGEAAEKGLTTSEGQRRLGLLLDFMHQLYEQEVQAGIRVADEHVWVVPTSAKNRENVAHLVKQLAASVKAARDKAAQEEAALLETLD